MVRIDGPIAYYLKLVKDKLGEIPQDSTAALAALDGDATEIEQEKIVAAVAMHNNKNAFSQDIHGFANAVLIMNSVPASIMELPILSPRFLAYALWEMPKDIPYNHDIINYIVTTFYEFGHTIVPEFLEPLIGELLAEKVGRDLNELDKLALVEYIEDKKMPKDEATQVRLSRHLDTVIYLGQMIQLYKEVLGE